MRPAIDAHFHLWELDRFPYLWLAPDAPPRPFGDHGALKRDYLLPDYIADARNAGLVGSVFVEANSGAPGPAEIEWVDEVAQTSGLPIVTVAAADLRRQGTGQIVDSLRRSPRLRGVRMSLCWHDEPRWRFVDRPDVMLDGDFRAGLAALTRQGLVFDVVVVPGQLAQLAELAHANPDQRIVIDHLGTPWFATEADRLAWREGVKACARCPNVFIKISGLWPLDRSWRPDIISEPVRLVIGLFGPDRCLWGSNLPVEKLMCPVAEQLRSLEEVLHDLAEPEKDMIFRTTAMRVYRIEPRA